MVLLSALIAIAPFSIDAYMPAFGRMANFYGTDFHTIELTISVFFIGSAIGQLLLAPFSDRLGRRPVLFLGLALFLVATLCIIFSQSIEQLLTFRFIQALGCGSISVTAPSAVRDCFNEQNSARMFSIIATLMMAAPFVAPMVGAGLLQIFEWQSIFWFLLVYATFITVLMVYKLPETRPRTTKHLELGSIVRNSFGRYKQVFKKTGAIQYLLCIALCSVWMMLFLTDASFIYIEYFGQSEFNFAMFFGGAVLVVITANFVNIRLLRKHVARRILFYAIRVQCALVFGLLVYVNFFTPNVWVVFILFAMTQACLHVITANGFASFLSYYTENSGAATAIFGSVRFGFGGAASILLAKVHNGTLLPFAIITSCALIFGLVVSYRLDLRPIEEIRASVIT